MQQNLSPLAFIILKYLCSSDTGAYQTLNKEIFGVESQEDFLSALSELESDNSILLSRDPAYEYDMGVDELTTSAIIQEQSPKNQQTISAKINTDAGDICAEINPGDSTENDANDTE